MCRVQSKLAGPVWALFLCINKYPVHGSQEKLRDAVTRGHGDTEKELEELSGRVGEGEKELLTWNLELRRIITSKLDL